MIYFIGHSFAADHLRRAAIERKLPVCFDVCDASIIFVSQDTPTAPDGTRDEQTIRDLLPIEFCKETNTPLVITSQVTPGFCRSLGYDNVFHQAETLRINDAWERALNPEQIIVGGEEQIPAPYAEYLLAFRCPVLRMTWEEAEFSKIAINMTLAAQVENTNRLAAAATKVGAGWGTVAMALRLDKRIGPHSYLTPGRWQDSPHLLRDHVTLEAIRTSPPT